MVRFREIKKVFLFHLALNFFMVFFITGASYYHTPLEGGKDSLVYFIHLCALQCFLAAAIYFLSFYRGLFRILFPIAFFISALFAFWGYTQDLSVTPSLMQAIFETKANIAVDLITVPLVIYALVLVAFLYGVIKFYRSIRPRAGWKVFLIPALACFAIFPTLEHLRPGSLKNRLPFTIYFGTKGYFEKPKFKLFTEASEVIPPDQNIKMVFVLGETVRADHLSINGYSRETTPLLQKQANLISFPRVYTQFTYTGASVPQIITNQTFRDLEGPFISFSSVANQAHYETIWIGNQTLEKSFENIVQTNQKVALIDAYKSEFSFSKQLDESMLPVLDTVLKKNPRQLITLHMMGSHWWYENRYSEKFRTFEPVITSKYIPSLKPEEIVNSYDNTILYLDSFLNETINRLEQETAPTVMVYVSDHGEHLGESGKWLHAQAGDEVKNPAVLIWFSESYQKQFPFKVAALKKVANQRLTTNMVFPMVLDLLDIKYRLP